MGGSSAGQLAGWHLDVDVSSEWLFFRVGGPTREMDFDPPLAERAWAIAARHGIYRLVLELEEGVMLSSRLVGQIVRLHKGAHTHGGVLRLCGLPAENYHVLETMSLDNRFPNYRTREDAVMGYRPRSPR